MSPSSGSFGTVGPGHNHRRGSCLVEDNLSGRYVGEDVVFDFIWELDAIIELQEEFNATDDMVVYRF